jgi:hypothetical protein
VSNQTTPVWDDQAKIRVIRDFIQTAEGRAKLASSMQTPTEVRVAYKALTRLFPKPGEDREDEGRRLHRTWRFEVLLEANTHLLRAFTGLGTNIANEVLHATNDHVLEMLDDLAGEPLEGPFDPLPRGFLVMNPLTYVPFVKEFHAEINRTCARELLKTGLQGDWRHMDLLTLASVPPGPMYRVGPHGTVASYRSSLELSSLEEESQRRTKERTEAGKKGIVLVFEVALDLRLYPVEDPQVTRQVFP